MIRKYNEQDADAIVSLWRKASAVAHPFLSADFIDSEAKALRDIYLTYAETWVTVVDGKIVGFIALVEDEVAGLFLLPDFHGQGFGREMVDLAHNIKGPLRVEVFDKNQIGRRFYAAYGFLGTETYIHDATGETVLKLAYTSE